MARQKKSMICPLGATGVGGKWMFWILHHLLSGPRRFGELQRLIPHASRQMLTIQLRELEQRGVLHRRVTSSMPPNVEYTLSNLGRTLEPGIRQFFLWVTWYCDQTALSFDDVLVSLASRWKFRILYHVFSGPRRFSELQRQLPQASRSMLASQLRELEQMGLIQRRSHIEEFPKIEYSLSDLGRRSEQVLRQLCLWGKWYCDQTDLEFDWPENDIDHRHRITV